MIQRKLISSNMKSQNPFCCCCLVSHISSFIGFSEVYRVGGGGTENFLISEKKQYIKTNNLEEKL